jgi:hypothetical protein
MRMTRDMSEAGGESEAEEEGNRFERALAL